MLYALLALGFAGLIGAHELAASAATAGDDAMAAPPLILAAAGTLCFVVAGVLAYRMMKQRAPE
jgi:hypothetical protein